MSRPLPGPNGDYHYPTSVALSASRRAFVRRGKSGLPAGRGASVMFDTEYSILSVSPEETPNGMRGARFGSAIAGSGVPGAQLAALDGERTTLAVSQATSASDIEMPNLSDRSIGNGKLSMSPVSQDWKPPARRGLGGFTPQGSEGDTEECTSSSENLNMETKEGPPSSERRRTGDE
ncbi:unnamed protein product [Laminaria digitata]